MITVLDWNKISVDKNLSLNEFHVSREIREKCDFDEGLFASSGNIILANFKNVRLFAKKINDLIAREEKDSVAAGKKMIKAGQLNAMGLIDEIFHYVCGLYRRDNKVSVFEELLGELDTAYGKEAVDEILQVFNETFPPVAVFKGEISVKEYLAGEGLDAITGTIRSNRVSTLEELILLRLANENPAFKPFYLLFNDDKLKKLSLYEPGWDKIKGFFKNQPVFGPNNVDLITMLKEPVVFSPDSLKGQLDYIRTYWSELLGEWLTRLLAGMDMISEEEKAAWAPLTGAGSNGIDMAPYNYDSLLQEYERFSPDKEWMPKVILMAKTVLVWLDQLSKKYKREITRLDQIPDEELDLLAHRGFTGLWLIGLWERSHASKRIKQICGNPEAAASAYSLYDYDIAQGLGGWDALDNLRRRLWQRGIRLASDMVPNHTGMDSRWINEKPDMFVQTRDCPFPTYTFNGENLSLNDRVGVYLEDHYYSKNDCAVVFKRVDHYTGDVRYIYHGNDGTGMPWNDTAQIDFLNPEAREAVIQEILHVARNFPIIRFDAAMVLAKKHIRRLWYPEPGQGGDIASRAEHAISRDEFEAKIPNEFWREVVDRVATEVPDTLLLAEAFWMMEGYFVRTLGMHRVYNSAFMNMLKREDNFKYRQTIKNTIEFDPQILKRYVNFMNNPDEETAVAQFGKEDKYFGVCTLMVTMPGLPMFGHGQIEGFTEKYGMEFTKAYWNETPDENLIARHERDIFPLMKKRYLFAEIENFLFYDVWDNGVVNENVFAYSNRCGSERAVVFYNNVYQQASGWIKQSCAYAVKTGSGEKDIRMETKTIGEALGLTPNEKNFCIFREQRSGLWYIRSAKDICDNGLYLRLNGFESQVMMDIYQVADDETGKYRCLMETLDGRGVSDIDTALREIFLKELYKAFADVITKDFVSDMALLCKTPVQLQSSQMEKPAVAQVLERVKPAIMTWIDIARQFIDGNYGAKTVIDLDKCGKLESPKKVWEQFEKSFTAMFALFEKGQTGENTYATSVFEGIVERPRCGEILGSFSVLYTLRLILGSKATAKNTADLISLWGLDRKLRDILLGEGISVATSYIPLRSILCVLPFIDVLENMKTAKKTEKDEEEKISPKVVKEYAALLMHSIVTSSDAALIAGVNVFDNIVWFNDEKMADAMWFGTVVPAVIGSLEDKYALLEAMYKALMAAKKKAEYKVDNLTTLLPLPTPKVKAKATGEKVKGKAGDKSEKSSSAKTKTVKSSKKKDDLKK